METWRQYITDLARKHRVPYENYRPEPIRVEQVLERMQQQAGNKYRKTLIGGSAGGLSFFAAKELTDLIKDFIAIINN